MRYGTRKTGRAKCPGCGKIRACHLAKDGTWRMWCHNGPSMEWCVGNIHPTSPSLPEHLVSFHGKQLKLPIPE